MNILRLVLLTLLASVVMADTSLQGGHVQLSASRGVEYYLGRLELHLPVSRVQDSLSVTLDADGLAGFRSYNDDNTRLVQNLGLSWFRTTTRLGWTAGFRQQAYKRRRHSDPVLSAELAAGLRYAAADWEAMLRAGAVGDQREQSEDLGPLLEAVAGTVLRFEDWRVATRGELRFDQPGERRNEQAILKIEAGTHATQSAGNQLQLSLQHMQEDIYAGLETSSIERRRNQGAEINNRLWSRPLDGLELAATVGGWLRRQVRDAQDESASGRDTKYEDQGVDLGLEGHWQRGLFMTSTRFALTRSRQDSRYGEAMSSRNLTRIQVNELSLNSALQGKRDTLDFRAETRMRRRDSDFERLSALRDEDYSDLGKHSLKLHYGKQIADWAGLGASIAWGLTQESHLQAERSGNNYNEYSLLAAVPHRLRLPADLVLHGKNSLRTSWRSYDHDSDENPRSYIQRRWQWLEQIDWRLPGGGRWRRDLQVNARWLEEDGGSYRKSDGYELLSDSAEELEFECALSVSRNGWLFVPGFRWYRRQDWSWDLQDEERVRSLLRKLYRRGPLLTLACRQRLIEVSTELSWELVGDGGDSHNDFRVDLQLRYSF